MKSRNDQRARVMRSKSLLLSFRIVDGDIVEEDDESENGDPNQVREDCKLHIGDHRLLQSSENSTLK